VFKNNLKKKDLKNNEEYLLRRYAADGEFNAVQEILNKNKNKKNSCFNINAQSSNGNTALHWACFNAKENHGGYSEAYNETIRLLIQSGASHLIKNKCGKIPHDFLQDLHVNVDRSTLPQELREKISCYFTLVNELLKIECTKITSSEELEGELASATAFHFIISSLKLSEFFPPENNHQNTFTILSLACGISTEIIPLIMYFQYQNKKVNYIGIDNNRDVIDDNKNRYRDFKNVKFICADASNLDEITNKVALEPIDLGILRNPDFTKHNNRQRTFCKIVDQIFPCLIKTNCPLLITFQTKDELDICSNETELHENFIQFKPKNFCDVGKLCSFSAQYQNETVITYPDRFSAILNLNKPNNDHALLNHHFRTLQL
jgi:ankyrin repeat protein